MRSHAAIVLQRFRARWLFAQAGHRDIADLQQLGRGEERHVRGVVINRVHHATFVNHHGPLAALL
jgi:hypothetical protein